MDEGRFFISGQSVGERLKAGPIHVVAPCSAHFTIAFDGKKLFPAALWTKADRVTYLQTLTIRPL
jgi:hypothetical protein